VIFITKYRIKPFLSDEERKKLLEVFAKVGAGPGAGAHYVAADGSHGVVISETDDVVGAFGNIQHYLQWVEYDTKVMLKVEDAVPQIMAALS
jgi:hypothetical protein